MQSCEKVQHYSRAWDTGYLLKDIVPPRKCSSALPPRPVTIPFGLGTVKIVNIPILLISLAGLHMCLFGYCR